MLTNLGVCDILISNMQDSMTGDEVLNYFNKRRDKLIGFDQGKRRKSAKTFCSRFEQFGILVKEEGIYSRQNVEKLEKMLKNGFFSSIKYPKRKASQEVIKKLRQDVKNITFYEARDTKGNIKKFIYIDTTKDTRICNCCLKELPYFRPNRQPVFSHNLNSKVWKDYWAYECLSCASKILKKRYEGKSVSTRMKKNSIKYRNRIREENSFNYKLLANSKGQKKYSFPGGVRGLRLPEGKKEEWYWKTYMKSRFKSWMKLEGKAGKRVEGGMGNGYEDDSYGKPLRNAAGELMKQNHWVPDHRIPVSACGCICDVFNISHKDAYANHYKNMLPLSSVENSLKGDSIEDFLLENKDRFKKLLKQIFVTESDDTIEIIMEFLYVSKFAFEYKVRKFKENLNNKNERSRP